MMRSVRYVFRSEKVSRRLPQALHSSHCSSHLRAFACGAGGAKSAVIVNSNVLSEIQNFNNVYVRVPVGRSGNNNPELRRNKVVKALLDAPGTGVLPAAATSDFAVAQLVHSAGFVGFLEGAFKRWEDELHKDASYVLPRNREHADVALVPFHCVKSEIPLSQGLSAEFACYASDFETPIFQFTASVLREDLGVVVAAVDRITAGERATYALTTNPGHHAGPTYYSGFCYINNASIACALLEKAGRRTALLDLDFHGGNGSYDIAKSTGWWFRSINCAGSYPWVDMGASGIELSAGMSWSGGYASALEGVLDDLPQDIDTLVVSLGYDTLATDPEAGKRAGMGLALQSSDFKAMGSMLVGKGLPLLVVQEGGYDLEHIPSAAFEFVSGLVS